MTLGAERAASVRVPASAIEIVRVAGLATIQDGGRPGRMHEGIPPADRSCPKVWRARTAR